MFLFLFAFIIFVFPVYAQVDKDKNIIATGSTGKLKDGSLASDGFIVKFDKDLYISTTTIMYAKKNNASILYHHPPAPGSNRLTDPQRSCSGNRTCTTHCQICTPPLKGKRINH